MPGKAHAQDGARWLLQTSIYTTHFSSNPEHNNNQNLINLEYQRPDRSVFGAAFFDSSFSQPSQYVYYGRIWRPLESAPLVHVKLTGGLIHGYKDKYRDKIPLNGSGIAPAIVPMIGLSGKRISGEVVLFGTAGAMVTLGVLF
ncbi:MAG: sn-glycerol-3-phosphate transporter [Burkholderiales bacterium]|nr:sn-glycerol-3-phosphate transporter [Burkholderiales bacterium]